MQGTAETTVTTAGFPFSRPHLSSSREKPHTVSTESSTHSRIAHNTSTTTTPIDTLDLTLYISPALTQQASSSDQTNMVELGEDMDRFFEQYLNNDAYANNDAHVDINMSINSSDVNVHDGTLDSGLDAHDARDDIELTEYYTDVAQPQCPGYMFHDLNAQDGMVQEEVNLNALDDATGGSFQFSRENYIQQTHFFQDQNWELPSYNHYLSQPTSPTNTNSSFGSQQPLTPQSWDSPSYEDQLLPSPNIPSPEFSFESDFGTDFGANFENMFLNQSPAQTPSPASDLELASPENPALVLAFDPSNSTPTSPGPRTPLTPLTPAPSPPSPGTSSKARNGPGSIAKPGKRKRRPSTTSGIVKPLRCQFPGDADSAPCNKEFDRNCDLKKHAKRHVKPYPCRFEGCKNTRGFSSEKDRERHENCLHKKECLVCPICGHETPRKDNMKDHVSRKHGKDSVDDIMLRIMAGSRTSPKPDGGEEEKKK